MRAKPHEWKATTAAEAILSHGPLEYIAMDTLTTLPKTKQGSQYVVVMTACYTELTIAISITKTNATKVARLCLGHWTVTLCHLSSQHINNGLPHVSKLFGGVVEHSWGEYRQHRRVPPVKKTKWADLSPHSIPHCETTSLNIELNNTYAF